jgi:ketosteroid isomerase-like protein
MRGSNVTTENAQDWTRGVFALVDAGDADRLVERMTPDAVLRFGNADPIVGRSDIHRTSTEFYNSLASLSHEVVNAWRNGDMVFAELLVSYVRHDGGALTLPCANVFELAEDGLIARYQIYMDVAPVFA